MHEPAQLMKTNSCLLAGAALTDVDWLEDRILADHQPKKIRLGLL
jgi:hypothetical protein